MIEMNTMRLNVVIGLVCGMVWTSQVCADAPVEVRWLQPDTLEVQVGGRTYQGTVSRSPCFTPQCRGPYRNVARHDRRHVIQGTARVVAPDGAALACHWVEFRKALSGQCTDASGQVWALQR